MIFIDSNVPMYLIGADHANKRRAIELLEEAIRSEDVLLTSTEVFQEIMHRYTALKRIDAIDAAFECLFDISDDILSFGMKEVNRARAILDEVSSVSARDALHVAVMEGAGSSRIMSFDRGFDRCAWIERIG